MSEYRSAGSTTVFGPELSSYASFRIPAVVNTAGGILAFCEGRRHSAADNGEIDIVLRRSADGGRSWGPLRIVATADHATVGNPAPVVDPLTGTVVLLSVQNPADLTEHDILRGRFGRRVFVQRSQDSGRTFSAPLDITAQTRPAHWGWYATGPGHGIALGCGRLVVPANHSVLPHPGGTTAQMYGAHCLLSDDGGLTWTVGFTDDNAGNKVNANESTVAELPDGRLYFNARNQGGLGTRVDTYSADGGRTLTYPYRPQPSLLTPVVQGSLLQWPGGPLLYSGPCHQRQRARMGIQVSSDHGRCWRIAHILDDRPAGYSDLVRCGERTLGILYETGVDGPYEEIRFHRLEFAAE